jgi:hypothetical protein
MRPQVQNVADPDTVSRQAQLCARLSPLALHFVARCDPKETLKRVSL